MEATLTRLPQACKSALLESRQLREEFNIQAPTMNRSHACRQMDARSDQSKKKEQKRSRREAKNCITLVCMHASRCARARHPARNERGGGGGGQMHTNLQRRDDNPSACAIIQIDVRDFHTSVKRLGVDSIVVILCADLNPPCMQSAEI